MALTPGPWTFDGRRWIRDAAGRGVLRLQIGASPDDAQVAAAGPQMLAALRQVALLFAGADDDELPDLIAKTEAAVREAIAAAEPVVS